MHRTYYIRDGC